MRCFPAPSTSYSTHVEDGCTLRPSRRLAHIRVHALHQTDGCAWPSAAQSKALLSGGRLSSERTSNSRPTQVNVMRTVCKKLPRACIDVAAAGSAHHGEASAVQPFAVQGRAVATVQSTACAARDVSGCWCGPACSTTSARGWTRPGTLVRKDGKLTAGNIKEPMRENQTCPCWKLMCAPSKPPTENAEGQSAPVLCLQPLLISRMHWGPSRVPMISMPNC